MPLKSGSHGRSAVSNDQGVHSHSPLAPLAQPLFRSIWIANLVSNLGQLIQGVGAAWLMTSIASSVDMVALVQASTALPVMLFALIGGTIADSYNRRGVMIVAQTLMLVTSALLALCTFAGMITPWLLLGFTFTIGCGYALNNPSWQASAGDLVERPLLPAAVALNSLGFNVSRSFGPALGGIVVASAGAATAFALNAVTYAGMIFVLWRWKQPRPSSTALPREAIGPALVTGLRYIAMSPGILRVLARCFVFGFAGVAVQALLPAVAAGLPDGGPVLYGMLLGAFGLGAIAGALCSARLQQLLPAEWLTRLAMTGFALCSATFVFAASPVVLGGGLLLGGACWVFSLSLFNVSIQLSAPRWVVGRALSAYQTTTFGGMGVGSWAWGAVAEHFGMEAAFGCAAATLAAGAALGLLLPLAPRSTRNLEPSDKWQMPETKIDVEGRSGPIVVMVTYRISDADLPAFAAAVAARQRIRRRDGVRRWRLLRDLTDPALWTEVYETANWTEYRRHHLRRTKADAELIDALRDLHVGDEPPVVRRFIERHPLWLAGQPERARPSAPD